MTLTDEKINILIVDDRPENLISLSAILDRQDYNLVKAESGREALKHLLDQEFALILLDVQMPVLDGFETAALIKQREKSKHIPIIFVTAVGKDELFLFKGYDVGAVDYIIKPFEPCILRSKVEVFADLHRKTQALKRQVELERLAERLQRERAIAELELAAVRRDEAANRKYRELVEDIHHGFVWAADPATLRFTFRSGNASKLLGTQGQGWMDWVHPDDRQMVFERMMSGLPLESEYSFEFRVLRAPGAVVWLKTAVRRAERFDGKGDELRGLSVDISELKEAEEIAQRAISLRDDFLSIASHELKTPLTSLLLALDSLKRFSLQKDAQKVVERLPLTIERSYRQMGKLTRLVDELLDVSRINSGQFTLTDEEVDLMELARDVCARLSEDAKRASCALVLHGVEKVIGRWDRLRIEQVVTNLVSNGIKYGPGKPIEIEVGEKDGYAVLSVRDYGIGIAEGDQARIFSKFERAVPNRNFGGLGLGLYIAHQIVDAHEGEISVESTVGAGARFSVRLPFARGKRPKCQAGAKEGGVKRMNAGHETMSRATMMH